MGGGGVKRGGGGGVEEGVGGGRSGGRGEAGIVRVIEGM